MRATHPARGQARRRSCDRSPLSCLDASFPALLFVVSSLTTHVLQNNPPCQDAELNSALRNYELNARSTHTRESSVSEVVKLERHDGVAIVTVDSPPVNALSAAVRGGILECIKSAIADPAIKAIVLTCAGRTFIAGADITEFGKPPKPPGLNDVLAAMENSPKPIVAAIHGTALGGGLEVALACHFRVAAEGRQARPARGQARPAAGRRRHAAPAARGRSGERGQDDRRRRSDRRGGSAEDRPGRGDRRGSGCRRRGLRAQGAGREAPAAHAARRRQQARGGQGRSLDLHQCGRRA